MMHNVFRGMMALLILAFGCASPALAVGVDEIQIIPDTGEAVGVDTTNTVVIDPATGTLVESDVALPMAITVTRLHCPPGAACWASGSAMGDLGFSGIGTAEGNWPSRNAFYTGNKSGRICYLYDGKRVCSQVLPPNTVARMVGGKAVTGVSVSRY